MMPLKKNVKVEKYFDGHGVCTGKLDKKEKVDSTLYPGQERDAWIVKYEDDTTEHFEEEELRSGKDGPGPAQGDGKPVLVVRGVKERDAMYDALKPGFDYLEARITGTCAQQYSLVGMYETCRLVRIFDPNFASQHLDSAYVNSNGKSRAAPLRRRRRRRRGRRRRRRNGGRRNGRRLGLRTGRRRRWLRTDRLRGPRFGDGAATQLAIGRHAVVMIEHARRTLVAGRSMVPYWHYFIC